MTETAIKPCPFCGSVPTIFQREHPAITHVPLAWIVQCTGCTAETCSEHLQWAIDYWNRRPNPETQAVADKRADSQFSLLERRLEIAEHKILVAIPGTEGALNLQLQDAANEVGKALSMVRLLPPPVESVPVWQPIATAPKTGEHILVAEFNPERIGFGFCGGKKQSMMTVAHWWDAPGEEGWYASVDSVGEYSFPATHWKSLNEL